MEKYHEKKIKQFEEQKNYIMSLLEPNERISLCLDNESFLGKYYNPNWVVTDMGRIYSLWKKDWIKPYKKNTGKRNLKGEKTANQYYYVKNKKDITVHGLVANYFCDKRVVQLFGEEAVEIHHIKSFDENKSCEENNNAKNLQYIASEIHKKTVTQIQNGNYKIPKETDILTRIMMNSASYHQGTEISTWINEDGKEEIKIKLYLGNQKN